ncbi:MAG TPA: DUF2844 domain-containing protein [Candidatus Binataceae bacterium]|nr:DUF2844 domain-containing protein [Candidatus Binataceae bacterium]
MKLASSTHRLKARLAAGLALSALLALAPGVNAGLGDHINTQQSSSAGMLKQSQPSYQVFESVDSTDHVTLDQYASSTGTVFAVAWRGAGMPDLRAVFGAYFAQFSALRQHAPAARHLLSIEDPSLMVDIHGPNSDIIGRAWVPALVPAGVDVNTVVQPPSATDQ